MSEKMLEMVIKMLGISPQEVNNAINAGKSKLVEFDARFARVERQQASILAKLDQILGEQASPALAITNGQSPVCAADSSDAQNGIVQ
ncbi:MAG TPA: hypothetical protein VFM46_12480 [Pseudomonadales bacterium]|nr:hypothetical protein [Pseudomonadales bacterium]